jgi:hypothetical protein
LALYSAAFGKFGAMSWSVISPCHPLRAFPSEETQDGSGRGQAFNIL